MKRVLNLDSKDLGSDLTSYYSFLAAQVPFTIIIE